MVNSQIDSRNLSKKTFIRVFFMQTEDESEDQINWQVAMLFRHRLDCVDPLCSCASFVSKIRKLKRGKAREDGIQQGITAKQKHFSAVEDDSHSEIPQQDNQVEAANMSMNDLPKQIAAQNEDDTLLAEDETIGEVVR